MILRKKSFIKKLSTRLVYMKPCKDGIQRLLRSRCSVEQYIRRYDPFPWHPYDTSHKRQMDILWLRERLNDPYSNTDDFLKLVRRIFGDKK